MSNDAAHSFSVRQDREPYINNYWHYHPEIELIHFQEGHGMQFIGDSVRPFSPGDVILVGSQLPHYWRFDPRYFDKTGDADVRVAHFCDNFWGAHFLDLPENRPLKTILEQAKRGLQVLGPEREAVAALLQKMVYGDGAKRIIYLIEALTLIADSRQTEVLSSLGFRQDIYSTEDERLKAIYAYTMEHFKRKIPLEEIAEVACISPHSFCRYFKSSTRKTYSQFLMEVKVGHACRLLIENRQSIKQLCFESGFNNFTSFHKYFKRITGKSPLHYQREYVAKQPEYA
jgi:AraC-like DNA-binding protein